jgi:phosphatidylethanolamine-binding protein (PEBP) family uncharacterized protein
VNVGRCGHRHQAWRHPSVPAYVFQLFALDYHPDLPAKFTLTDALQVMTGHVLGRARLDGTYEVR